MPPSGGGAPRKFPDYVAPTKIHYVGERAAAIHLREASRHSRGGIETTSSEAVTLGFSSSPATRT